MNWSKETKTSKVSIISTSLFIIIYINIILTNSIRK